MAILIRPLLTAILTALCASAWAQQLTHVTVGTSWVAGAHHGGYYQAMVDGSYESCGLDVEIVPGGPQANNTMLLLSGRLDFMVGRDLLSALRTAEQGAPIRVLAAHYQRSPIALAMANDRLFNTETISHSDEFLVSRQSNTEHVQWLAEQSDLNSGLTIIEGTSPSVLSHGQDAIWIGSILSNELLDAKEDIGNLSVHLLAREGYYNYASTIEALSGIVEEHPDTVRCFVDASAIGWANYLYGDPSEANDLMMEANPDLTMRDIERTVKVIEDFGLVDSDAALDLGLGSISEDRVSKFIADMVDQRSLSSTIPYEQVILPEYANSGAALEYIDQSRPRCCRADEQCRRCPK